MGKIVLLDELTINQIAAGEVIERPSSVVKEMLENSIDAGAKNITVEVKNGGISLIRITDDGCGISEDDMEIAFERHATSKIRNAGDLQTVKTMGFRGEALASIAAIANVEMVSKTAEDPVGHRIVVEGGKVLEETEIGCVTGTRITVQNLFFNTPVRYKFLKKDFTEAGYIEDIVTRIALANKEVAIKLINNDKVLLQTTGSTDVKNIIYSIFGKDVANGIKEVEYTFEDIKVTGVIGLPEIARSNRTNQLFYVNGRFVRDKSLTAGIEQAYKNLIPSGKYAFAVLNLEMDPNEVDVNVHPAKLEVRFEDEQKVFRAVYHTVKYALDGVEAAPISIDNYSIADLAKETETEKADEEELAGSEVISSVENVEKQEYLKAAEKLEEKAEEKAEEKQVEVEETKKPFANLLKKFKKQDEDEDDDEEDEKDNTLLEIFNARKNGEDLSKPLEFINNEDIAEKETKLGDTLVSSNTRELDFDVAEALKDRTLELDSVAKIEKQETMQIPTVRQTVSAETQIIDTINNLGKDEKQEDEGNEISKALEIIKEGLQKEINAEESEEKVEGLEESSEENANIQDEEPVEKIEEAEEASEEEIESIEKPEVSEDTAEVGSLEATVPTLDAVEKITSKILEMKMNSLDRTQMIDTSKVREAILDSQKITPEFADMYKKTFGLDANEIRKEKELEKQEREKINVSNEFATAENDSLFEKEPEIQKRVDYKFVGLAFENYIIIEYRNEMYIIDELSARERINYEKVKYIYYSDERFSTTLLLPDIVTCTPREMSIARENIELFEKAGFDFEEFGENTLKLIAVPEMCEELNTKTLFLDILNEIGNVAVNDIEEKEKKFIRAVAVNSVIKPKIKLDEKEVDSLIQDLLSLDDPFAAPQGRSTAVKMSRSDIEKKFARRK